MKLSWTFQRLVNKHAEFLDHSKKVKCEFIKKTSQDAINDRYEVVLVVKYFMCVTGASANTWGELRTRSSPARRPP